MDEENKLTETVHDAVNILVSELSEEDQEAIKNGQPEDVIWQHFNLGMYVRNKFGLWGKNPALLKDCGHEFMDADGASAVIVFKLFEKLKPGLWKGY